MSLRIPVGVLVAVVGVGSAVGAEPAKDGADVFGLTKVHQVHLKVSAKDYAAMDPPPPKSPFGGMAKAPAGRPGPAPADMGAGNFNFEFEYVHADVEADGQTIKNVGLRYKGSGSYL